MNPYDNDNLVLNKEVSLLRIALTTRCILRCRYCFVSKTNKNISYATAMRAIRLLLNSPGKIKLLMLYGGEPLICFDLIRRLIESSMVESARLKKRIFFSIATNAILLTGKKLDFLKQANVKLSVSIDGDRQYHDRWRRFANGKGSFREAREKIGLVFDKMNKRDVSALFGVLPSSAGHMYDNLLFLVDLGFENINIEPIQGARYLWGNKEKKVFLKQLRAFTGYLCGQILKRKYLFLSPVSRQLRNARLNDAKRKCPFFGDLEIYPGGEIAFSPFLMNAGHRSRYIVGNINSSLCLRYRDCVYSPGDSVCADCWQQYYEGSDLAFFCDIVALRNAWSTDTARLIKDRASEDARFKNYLAQAKKRVFE